MGALLQATDGNFYGTTKFGGAGFGTVFKMTPTGTVTVLSALSSDQVGTAPVAPLLQGTDGNFYGTTTIGSLRKQGTVFRMTPAGGVTVVHAFAGGSKDGAGPVTGVLQAADGALYGTTVAGGSAAAGTVFSVTPTGTFTLLHAFSGGSTDGALPHGGLVQAGDGTFVGTTEAGGFFGLGTLFRVMPGGRVTIVHDFAGGSTDGESPETGLLRATDGNFYGTTDRGGAFDRGTIFRLTAAGSFTLVYSFTGGSDGGHPLAGLIQASDGNLYGTTSVNGAYNVGTAFRVTLSGTLTILHAFTGGSEGAYPRAALLQASDGMFYGTTSGGGAFTGGTVFRMTLRGEVMVLAALSSPDGLNPSAPLVEATDGSLYGTTPTGGPFGQGVVFRVRLHAPPLAPAIVIVGRAGRSSVRLTWAPVATGATYAVKRATVAGTETVLASGITGTTFVDNATTIAQSYYYIISAVNASGESLASYEVSITAGRAASGDDFDGDGKADISVFRPATATWYIRYSGTLTWAALAWGGASDIPVPGDYDGDGITDLAVFRPSTGTWYVRFSGTGTTGTRLWGGSIDTPVPGDYDGDGKTDIAVFRPSTGTWYILYSGTLTWATIAWGGAGDVPVSGDYDGDGKTDVAIFRPSTGQWFVRQSSTFTSVILMWGGGVDIPVPGDYDGDGKTDIAVFRPSTGTWYIRYTATPTWAALIWGGGSDIPILRRP